MQNVAVKLTGHMVANTLFSETAKEKLSFSQIVLIILSLRVVSNICDPVHQHKDIEDTYAYIHNGAQFDMSTLTWKFLYCGRKPEFPEKTHT